MEVLDEDLEVPTSPLFNGNVESNRDNLKHGGHEWRLMRLHNAIMLVSRIPLETISLQRKNRLFEKLLNLDQAIVSGNIGLPLRKTLHKTDLLLVLRHAMNRFVSVIARDVVEVIHSLDIISFSGYSPYRQVIQSIQIS